MAGWGDYVRLLRIATVAQIMVTVQHRFIRGITIFALVVLAAEAVYFSVSTGSLLPAGILFGLLIVGLVVTIVGHTAWRLIDPHRLVFLSPERRCCLDVRYANNGTVKLSNHAKLSGTSSAPALRDAVASWTLALGAEHVMFKAQDAKVAALYMEEFPRLEAGEPDAYGRVPLTLS